MTKANLRPQIQKNIDTPDLPQVTLAQLIAKKPDNYDLFYDDADSDNITFELVREDETITISGRIRRWQGTQSRLELDGKVNVPYRVSSTRKIIFGLIIAVPTIATIRYFITPGLLYLFGFIDYPSTFTAVDPYIVTILSMLLTTFLMVFYISIAAYVAKGVLFTDNNGNKRWQRKQELNKKMTSLETLSNGVEEVDISRLTDENHIGNEDTLSEQVESKSVQS